ncbi:hypothetical protein [Sporichthya sp.]|uniref:hypothetical protein n=1 Tax=Sporichthya sp. TaxID=65475 RepID=UPI001794091D|nr:hypothetical protein [Sporichthya sp.]MBA3745285.1 hypothetical protein [Sporichthya sp.]
MTVIAMFSDKGSPGVTTLALTLAATWPRPVTIVECDPAGGDLALRLTDEAGRPQLAADSGLLALAAAARRSTTSALDEHARPVPGLPNLSVVTGLSTPEQGAGIVELWPAITAALTGPGPRDVLADLGRLHPGSPAHSVAAAADVLVGVARGDAAGLLRLRERLHNLLETLPQNAGVTRRVAVVLIVDDRQGTDAVSSMRAVLAQAGIAATVTGYLAHDPGAVQALQQGRTGPRVERSLLLRSARSLATELTVHQSATAEPTPATGPVPRRRLAALVRSR